MITHTEIDGVPAVHARTDGPMTAGLLFRVGRADESLARGGITHLVEHLALHRLGLADYHFNGVTSPVTTSFLSQGSESDVVAFLNGVCAGLADLPVDRMATEKEILRTEAAGRGASISEPLAVWRYGARGHGLIGYPEFGLAALTPDELRAWAARYFTRENAVLWVAGETIPAGLKLALPGGGVRVPAPEVTSALPETPAYFCGPTDRAVAYEVVVRRSTAASVYAGVLERAMFRALRQDGGYSYTAGTSYEARDGDHAVIVALADALPEKRDAMVGEFVDVLAALRYGRVDRADVDAHVAKTVSMLAGPDGDARRLPGYARNKLLGQPNVPIEEFLGELHAITPEDVARVAAEAHGTALLMIPDGRGADWAGFTAAPTRSEAVLPGRRHPMRADRERALVVGPEGVSLDGPGGPISVRYAETAALFAWPDGARRLIGHDAIALQVEPTLFTVDAETMGGIDAAVPAELRVDLPARDPEDIPRPPALRRGALRGFRRGAARTVAWTAEMIDAIPGLLRWIFMFGLVALGFRGVIGLLVEQPPWVGVTAAAAIVTLVFLLSGRGPRTLHRLSRRIQPW